MLGFRPFTVTIKPPVRDSCLSIFSGDCHCIAYDLSTLWPEIVYGETAVCFVTTPVTTYLQRQIPARGAQMCPTAVPFGCIG